MAGATLPWSLDMAQVPPYIYVFGIPRHGKKMQVWSFRKVMAHKGTFWGIIHARSTNELRAKV